MVLEVCLEAMLRWTNEPVAMLYFPICSRTDGLVVHAIFDDCFIARKLTNTTTVCSL